MAKGKRDSKRPQTSSRGGKNVTKKKSAKGAIKKKRTAGKTPSAKKPASAANIMKKAPKKAATRSAYSKGTAIPVVPKASAYAKVARTFNKYRSELMALQERRDPQTTPLITGVSPSQQEVKGHPTKKWAMVVVVDSEEDKRKLKENPEAYGLQKDYDGIPSDIQVRRWVNAAGNFPDGTCIRGALSGTLGTTVFVNNVAYWITAAHIVAPTPTNTSMFLCSNTIQPIGTVASGHYFRGPYFDIALITLSQNPGVGNSARTPYALNNDDVGTIVQIDGAITPNGRGRIVSLDLNVIVDGTESVFGHIKIARDPAGPLPGHGDSGALVSLLDGSPVGMFRAVSDDGLFAAVTPYGYMNSAALFFDL